MLPRIECEIGILHRHVRHEPVDPYPQRSGRPVHAIDDLNGHTVRRIDSYLDRAIAGIGTFRRQFQPVETTPSGIFPAFVSRLEIVALEAEKARGIRQQRAVARVGTLDRHLVLVGTERIEELAVAIELGAVHLDAVPVAAHYDTPLHAVELSVHIGREQHLVGSVGGDFGRQAPDQRPAPVVGPERQDRPSGQQRTEQYSYHRHSLYNPYYLTGDRQDRCGTERRNPAARLFRKTSRLICRAYA